jgi:hypothetical protein
MMMKFSLKHGLGLLVGLFLSAAALARRPVPIEDRDAFEKKHLACIMFEDSIIVSCSAGE